MTEKGYYGTSTREIAKRAGAGSGLLFHYFSNKDCIYLELVKAGAAENAEREAHFSFVFYYPDKELFFVGDFNQMKYPALPIRFVMQLAMFAP